MRKEIGTLGELKNRLFVATVNRMHRLRMDYISLSILVKQMDSSQIET